MRAVVQRAFGGPEVLEHAEVPRPEPAPGEVLVRVRAAGVNPIDLATSAGLLPGNPPGGLPFTVGRDVCGVVVEVGEGVTRFAPGDAVFGMLDARNGGYAQYVAAPAAVLAPVPAAMPYLAAGALPLAGLTAWQMLVEVARVESGQRVLVHAGAGGVGHLAVQIARTRGARVVATARAANHAFLHSLGADEVIDHTAVDFTTVVSGVDTVLDLVGGPNIPRSLAVLRPGGTLVPVRSAGYEADLEEAARRGIRAERFMVRPDAAGLGRLAALAEQGRLRVELHAVLPLERAAEAHRIVAAGRTRGKVVLAVGSANE